MSKSSKSPKSNNNIILKNNSYRLLLDQLDDLIKASSYRQSTKSDREYINNIHYMFALEKAYYIYNLNGLNPLLDQDEFNKMTKAIKRLSHMNPVSLRKKNINEIVLQIINRNLVNSNHNLILSNIPSKAIGYDGNEYLMDNNILYTILFNAGLISDFNQIYYIIQFSLNKYMFHFKNNEVAENIYNYLQINNSLHGSLIKAEYKFSPIANSNKVWKKDDLLKIQGSSTLSGNFPVLMK